MGVQKAQLPRAMARIEGCILLPVEGSLDRLGRA